MNHFQPSRRWALYPLMIAALFFLASCEGDVGPVGPVGPPGPQGPSGPQGPAGESATFSIKFSVFSTDWSSVGEVGDDGHFLFLNIEVPEITADIVENGIVLVYYRANDVDPWFFLPFTEVNNVAGEEFIEVLDYIYGLGFVELRSIANDRGSTAFEGTFRIIVAQATPLEKKGIDYSDYDAVMELFGISE